MTNNNYPANDEGQFYMYDQIDMQAQYWSGWRLGAFTGALGMFVVLFLVGILFP